MKQTQFHRVAFVLGFVFCALGGILMEHTTIALLSVAVGAFCFYLSDPNAP